MNVEVTLEQSKIEWTVLFNKIQVASFLPAEERPLSVTGVPVVLTDVNATIEWKTTDW